MLEMEHVKKRYGDFLLDASLHVRAGMVSALVGPNGAGKSTLFKTALGLVRMKERSVCLAAKCLNGSGLASFSLILDSAAICA